MRAVFFVLTAITALSCACSSNLCDEPEVRAVRKYISSSWTKTVRETPEDDGTLIGLPFPYTVPSPEGMFQELYYWDTYFTNEGLIRDGLVGLAHGNVDDMLYLVDRYGFIPNGNRTWYLSRSQPPFLSQMVRSVFEARPDTLWLARAYPTLEREYAFWMTERISECGLNCYSGKGADENLVAEFVKTGERRLKHIFITPGMPAAEHDRLGRNFVAEAESGWDMNPRFDRRCGDFCPVDLNSLLYMYETNFADFARILGKGETVVEEWKQKAERRRKLMSEFMFDKLRQQFYDYDFVNGKRSDVLSAAVFTTLFAGLATKAQAVGVVCGLELLEFRYGLSVCEDRHYEYEYQWSFPNCWPSSTFMTVMGLADYGYHRDAVRLSEKYIRLVLESYAKTGKLWEKYNVIKGTESVGSEYETPEMLGWSAGTFVSLHEYLLKKK